MITAKDAAHFSRRTRFTVWPLVAVIYLYRYTLGALFPASCKYHPSCSQYAIDALQKYGLVQGSLKAGWRLLRCNPWSHGGVDPA
jgi:putative membrane protein insertion efficiency factor